MPASQSVQAAPPPPTSTSSLPICMAPEDYQATRTHVFPSMESLKWFMRRNRGDLIAAQAMLIPNGRWLIQPENFDCFVLAIGMRRAAMED